MPFLLPKIQKDAPEYFGDGRFVNMHKWAGTTSTVTKISWPDAITTKFSVPIESFLKLFLGQADTIDDQINGYFFK